MRRKPTEDQTLEVDTGGRGCLGVPRPGTRALSTGAKLKILNRAVTRILSGHLLARAESWNIIRHRPTRDIVGRRVHFLVTAQSLFTCQVARAILPPGLDLSSNRRRGNSTHRVLWVKILSVVFDIFFPAAFRPPKISTTTIRFPARPVKPSG